MLCVRVTGSKADACEAPRPRRRDVEQRGHIDRGQHVDRHAYRRKPGGHDDEPAGAPEREIDDTHGAERQVALSLVMERNRDAFTAHARQHYRAIASIWKSMNI